MLAKNMQVVYKMPDALTDVAPTTLPGMTTTSSPRGRDVELQGFPLHMAEMLAQMPGASYIVRRSVHDPGHINQTRKAIKAALKVQLNQAGFSLVEILSNCPTNWGMSAMESMNFLKEQMVPFYPLGDYRIADAVKSLIVK